MTSLKRSREVSGTPEPVSHTQVSDPRPLKRQRFDGEQDTLHDLYQNIVIIYVGPDAHPFRIYKELACHDAKFFDAAFNGSFQEADKQEMSLPDDDVQVFRVYQTWLNLGELRYNFDNEYEDMWLHLAKLWIFADKICSTVFKNKIVNAFFHISTQNANVPFADPDTVRFVFEHTASTSPLRRVFVRLFMWLKTYSEPLSAYPVDFLELPLAMYLKDEKDFSDQEAYHEDCLEPCCAERRSS